MTVDPFSVKILRCVMNTSAESATAQDDPSRERAKLRQILDGARKVFLADGFDGASMNDIARAAGVSKGTLYVYFESKEALFEGLVRNDKQVQAEQICTFDAVQGDIEADLRRMARTLAQMLTRPEHIAMLRMVIGAAGKFPAIGRALYESGPQYGKEKLGAYLDLARSRGQLSIADTMSAAGLFQQLAYSDIVMRLLFCVEDTLPEERIEQAAENAVDVFLRIYAVTNAHAP